MPSQNNMIPLSAPCITGNAWKYVKDCLDTGWVSSVGKYVGRFEEIIREYVSAGYAVAAVNGTAALHSSLMVSGVGPGEEVFVPALTFVATVNVVSYCGAIPLFVDCDEWLCMDVDKLAVFVEDNCEAVQDGLRNRKTGRKIRALIPAHIHGNPVEMERLKKIFAGRDFCIIEDAAEAIGTEFNSRKVGTFGDLGCYSFNGNKIITTGGGGMIVTDDPEKAGKLRHLTTQAKIGGLEYDHDRVGFNYRLTNLQAALGVAQMEKLEEFIDIKRKNAELYRELLRDVEEVKLIWERPNARSNFWFYTIRVNKNHKNPLMESLLFHRIQVRPLWKPLATLPMYRVCPSVDIENAVRAYEECISLPCSVGLTEEEIRYVVDKLKGYFASSHKGL